MARQLNVVVDRFVKAVMGMGMGRSRFGKSDASDLEHCMRSALTSATSDHSLMAMILGILCIAQGGTVKFAKDRQRAWKRFLPNAKFRCDLFAEVAIIAGAFKHDEKSLNDERSGRTLNNLKELGFDFGPLGGILRELYDLTQQRIISGAPAELDFSQLDENEFVTLLMPIISTVYRNCTRFRVGDGRVIDLAKDRYIDVDDRSCVGGNLRNGDYGVGVLGPNGLESITVVFENGTIHDAEKLNKATNPVFLAYWTSCKHRFGANFTPAVAPALLLPKSEADIPEVPEVPAALLALPQLSEPHLRLKTLRQQVVAAVEAPRQRQQREELEQAVSAAEKARDVGAQSLQTSNDEVERLTQLLRDAVATRDDKDRNQQMLEEEVVEAQQRLDETTFVDYVELPAGFDVVLAFDELTTGATTLSQALSGLEAVIRLAG